jgi:hypothetical protein
LLLGCASGARAEPADRQAAYDALIDSALRAAADKDWAKARTDFEGASAVLPSARALRGAGVVSFEMGRYADALRLLQRALLEPGRRLDGELRTSTTKLAERAALHVGYYVIETNAPEFAIAVDGEEAVRDDGGNLMVDAGAHTLVVKAAGFVPRSLVVETRPTVTERWMVELERSSEVAASLAPSTPPPVHSAPSEKQKGGTRDGGAPKRGAPRTATWIALGAAPIFAIGAGLAWRHVNLTGDEIASACAMEQCSPEERELRIQESSMGTYETLTNVGLVLAGASLITAAVLYFVEGRSSSSPGAQARPSGPPTFQVRF